MGGRLIKGLLGTGFSRMEISSVGIGRISSPDLGTSPGIGGFLSSGSSGVSTSGIGRF